MQQKQTYIHNKTRNTFSGMWYLSHSKSTTTNGRISDFRWLVTLTLTRVVLHTIMHHSSTSTYTPNFIEIEETFCGQTDI